MARIFSARQKSPTKVPELAGRAAARQSFVLMVLLISLASMFGCTTMHTMHQPTGLAAKEQIQVGDEITVWTKSGRSIQLKVTNVSEDALFGIFKADGKKYKIPIAAIERIEYGRVNPWKTGFAVVGIAFVLLVLIVSTMDLDFAPSFD